MQALLFNMSDSGKAKLKERAHHIQKLIDVMGNPSEYQFTGNVIDCGPGAATSFNPPKCACGHPIRYQFEMLHPDGRKYMVGSTCIEQCPGISPHTLESISDALDNIKREERERVKRIKESAYYLEGELIELHLQQIKGWVMGQLHRRIRLPYDVWRISCWRYPKKTKYKTALGWLKAMRTEHKLWDGIMVEAYGEYHDRLPQPEVKDAD